MAGEQYAEAIAGAVVNALRDRLPPSTAASNIPRSTYEIASDLRPKAKHPKFSPPSMFESIRNRRSKKKTGESSKTNFYVRDVFLLPMKFQGSGGDISIPRSSSIEASLVNVG